MWLLGPFLNFWIVFWDMSTPLSSDEQVLLLIVVLLHKMSILFTLDHDNLAVFEWRTASNLYSVRTTGTCGSSQRVCRCKWRSPQRWWGPDYTGMLLCVWVPCVLAQLKQNARILHPKGSFGLKAFMRWGTFSQLELFS